MRVLQARAKCDNDIEVSCNSVNMVFLRPNLRTFVEKGPWPLACMLYARQLVVVGQSDNYVLDNNTSV